MNAGSVSASVVNFSQGFVNPKYIIVGVTYAPPGSSSSVQYANTTSVGSTSSFTQSFTSDVNITTSVGVGIGVPAGQVLGGSSVKLTYTESNDYTQGTTSTTTNTITKSSTLGYTTHGTPTFSPVTSDYDFIYLWLNPEILFSYLPGTNPQMIFTGYAFDPTDPASGEPPVSGPYVSGPDIVAVQVGCLTGHFSCPSDLVLTNGIVTSGTLARSWAANEYVWPTGDGPGLTSTDIANILQADPLVPSNNYTLLSTLPSTTSDGRFSKEPYAPSGPNVIQYPVGQPTETYNNSQTDASSVASGASMQIKQSFGVSAQFSINFTKIFSSSTTMSETQTFTWNYSYLDTLTTTNTLTNSLSITGPPDPPPTYSGPVQFIAYQDNIFGTFAFVPVPN